MAMAAAAGGRSGVIPATVHVQVRRLQPVLPGARGRAAGRAGHHRVLPGGVEVQVRQPPLHAMSAVRRRPSKEAPGLRCIIAPGRGGSRLARAGSAVVWSARGGRGDVPH
jgi:hypothetical protein